MIVFVHIPKTGGTSVRVAAAEYFGAGRVLHDYGPDARLTSSIVKKWIYKADDAEGFADQVQSGGYRFLAGHFPLRKYLSVLPQAHFVSWLREPVPRAWSAFLHHRARQGYRGSFREFYLQERFSNQQYRLLGGDLDKLDFVGILEHFALSLRRFNARFGTALTQHRANRQARAVDYAPDEQETEELAARNALDLKLYRLALKKLLAEPEQPAIQNLS